MEDHCSADSKFQRSNTDAGYSTTSVDSYDYSRTDSRISTYSDANDMHSNTGENPPGQPMKKMMTRSLEFSKKFRETYSDVPDDKTEDADLEMMKEKFSKLLLGEDMSGGGKGVCTAVAISNAITNLYATLFGQFKRLEPLSDEKKSMWKREMDCLLSVCDYIVEYAISPKTLPDGTTVELLTSKPRLDISMNLPALRKLDAMLLDIFDSFEDPEFWYIEGENISSIKVGMIGSFRRAVARTDEKWWLPVPCIPTEGLSEKARKILQQKRKCADQIHKAARAINTGILGEMQVPESYMATLPKSGRASIGDAVYKYMSTADPFAPEYLLNCLDIKSDHEALDVADRVESSMYVWRRKAGIHKEKPTWEMISELLAAGDKNVTLATRAESLLLTLKQRYPELSQTTLDTSKIQYNKDVGQAILESYSRVLEGLAFNIVARIDDVLRVDGSVKNLDG